MALKEVSPAWWGEGALLRTLWTKVTSQTIQRVQCVAQKSRIGRRARAPSQDIRLPHYSKKYTGVWSDEGLVSLCKPNGGSRCGKMLEHRTLDHESVLGLCTSRWWSRSRSRPSNLQRLTTNSGPNGHHEAWAHTSLPLPPVWLGCKQIRGDCLGLCSGLQDHTDEAPAPSDSCGAMHACREEGGDIHRQVRPMEMGREDYFGQFGRTMSTWDSVPNYEKTNGKVIRSIWYPIVSALVL